MARVTQEEIYEMNRLYRLYGTYSAVAKEMGRSPNTVKKYIDLNLEIEKKELKKISWGALSAAPKVNFKIIEWGNNYG